jgi:hypothetical protein
MSRLSKVVALTGMRGMRTLLLVGVFGALAAENCGGGNVVALQCGADSKYCLSAVTNELTCVPADPDNGCSGSLCLDCKAQLFQGTQTQSHVSVASCGGENKTCSVNSCDDHWGNCNQLDVDGCESDLKNGTRASPELVQNCKLCGVTCAGLEHETAHGTTTCQIGFCKYSCDTGWADCDGVFPGDGCECDLATHECVNHSCIPPLSDAGALPQESAE